MAKKIKAGSIGNIDASEKKNVKIEGSEMDSESLDKVIANQSQESDIDIAAEGAIGDVDASTEKNFEMKDSKSKKWIVWLVVAIGAILIALAGYYFSQEKKFEEKINEKDEEVYEKQGEAVDSSIDSTAVGSDVFENEAK